MSSLFVFESFQLISEIFWQLPLALLKQSCHLTIRSSFKMRSIVSCIGFAWLWCTAFMSAALASHCNFHTLHFRWLDITWTLETTLLQQRITIVHCKPSTVSAGTNLKHRVCDWCCCSPCQASFRHCFRLNVSCVTVWSFFCSACSTNNK